MARLFIFGCEEKGSGEHPIKFLFSKSPLFGDFVHGFPVVLNNRKGLLIGEGDIITLYCQPSQRLRKPFLSFNTNQKPHIKSPKCGDFENKNYIGCSPDAFSFRPNMKEEKAVWLCKTAQTTDYFTGCYRLQYRSGMIHSPDSFLIPTRFYRW